MSKHELDRDCRRPEKLQFVIAVGTLIVLATSQVQPVSAQISEKDSGLVAAELGGGQPCPLLEDPAVDLCEPLQALDCDGLPTDFCAAKVFQVLPVPPGGVDAVECTCYSDLGTCGPIFYDPDVDGVRCTGDCVSPQIDPCQIWVDTLDGTGPSPTGKTFGPMSQFPVDALLFCDCAPLCVDATDCDDGIKCTLDECLPDGTCVHTTIPGCCETDGDCSGKCDVCDPLTNQCVQVDPNCCESDDQCGKCELCALGQNECVPMSIPCCVTDADCTGKCDICDPLTNACVKGIPNCCDEDAQCPNAKCRDGFCDLMTNTCDFGPLAIGCCGTDADCPIKCDVCDPASNTCVPGLVGECCDSDNDCRKCNVCDLSTNTCVLTFPGCCAFDVECTGKCDICDLLTNTCVKGIPGCCDSDDQCTKCERCNFVTNTCEPFLPILCCETDADCTGKCDICDPLTNTCEKTPGCCESDADCDDGDPCTTDVCDPATNLCDHFPDPGCTPYENWVIADDFCLTCPECTCDVDGDGVCTLSDVALVTGCLGSTTPACLRFDFDCNGTVDVIDVDILTCLFGGGADCCPDPVRKEINRVRWYGSYLDPEFEPPADGTLPVRNIDSWLIGLHTDQPAQACPPPPPGFAPVDWCGTLKAGVETGCVLFTPDGSGSQYLIANPAGLSPYGVGDRLRICGYINPLPTTCQQGLGPVQVQSALPCGTEVSHPDRLVAQWAIDPALVPIDQTGKVGWDNHKIFCYTADLPNACLIHNFSLDGEVDSTGRFHPKPNKTYWISIQAAVGHRYAPNKLGTCDEIVTGQKVSQEYWGWHTTPPGYQQKDDAFMGQLRMGCPDEWIYDWMNPLHCSDPQFIDCCDDKTKSIDMAFYLLRTENRCSISGLLCTELGDCPPGETCDTVEAVEWCQPVNPGPPTKPVPPRPFPDDGVDELANTELTVVFNLDVVPNTIELFAQGPTVIARFQAQSEPPAVNRGPRPIHTEMVSMDLSGVSPVGPVRVKIGRSFGLPPSLGTVTPLSPDSDFPALAVFDVFFEIEFNGGRGVSDTPLRLEATVWELPPSSVVFSSVGGVELIDPDTGAVIGSVKSVDHTLPYRGGVNVHSDIDWINAPGDPCCEPLADGSGCVPVVCPDDGACFGECINGAYCDNADCCLIPGQCVCYLPNTKESIKRCGDCFGECIGGSYCDDAANPDCCINPGGCACYSEGSDISIQLCAGAGNTCFGECINGAYCDPVGDPNCCIGGFGACACYDPNHPFSIKLCQDPTQRQDECLPTCVKFDPLTGVKTVSDCDCVGQEDCHVAAGALGVAAQRGVGTDPCIVPDNGSGTIDLPPPGCAYLSPDEVHEIIDGLPPDVTIELSAIHKSFICDRQPGADPGFCPPDWADGICEDDGGDLGGKEECGTSTIELVVEIVTGSGSESTRSLPHLVTIDGMRYDMYSGPRNPGDAVQDFDTEIYRMQGELSAPDAFFDSLRITAGRGFGLPSPGHTTLTQLPNGDYHVDSSFDVTYAIEFVGAPGGPLEGAAGTSIGTIHMSTPSVGTCVAKCPDGEVCEETKTITADGQLEICCKCVPEPAPVCEPTDDRTGCKPIDCPDSTQICRPTKIVVAGNCAATGALCETDADCPAPDACVHREEVVECDCVPDDGCYWLEGIVAGSHICVGACDDGVTVCHATTEVVNGVVQFKCGCDEPDACEPTPDGSACEPFVCPGPLPPTDRCLPKCVNVDPLTGAVRITDCECRGQDECHVDAAGVAGGGAVALGTGGNPCVVMDDGFGVVTLPPEGCEYLSPDEVHKIIDGLPAGVTIELGAIHKSFICDRQPGDPGICSEPLPEAECETDGGSLGGKVECVDSTIDLTVNVITEEGGSTASTPHFMTFDLKMETHTAGCQCFDDSGDLHGAVVPMVMFRLQGEAPPDALFSSLRITAGDDFGLPSPGESHLTWLQPPELGVPKPVMVESHFDMTYRIEYVGAPGSVLEGMSGETTGTIRMSTGAIPDCVNTCPDPNDQCFETRTVEADGTITKCCECGCPPSSAPKPVPILDNAGNVHDLTTNRILIFRAGDLGRNQAIRVTLKDLKPPDDIWNGQQLWVGRPGKVSSNGASVLPIPGFGTYTAAQLQCEPHCRDDWSTWGEIHAFNEGVVPSSLYTLEVVDCSCDLSDKSNYSAPLELPTSANGDILEDFSVAPPGPPGNGVTILDVFGVVQAFQSAAGAPRKARADLEPNCLDLLINITDVLQAVTGLQGLMYGDTWDPKVDDLCTSPCKGLNNPVP